MLSEPEAGPGSVLRGKREALGVTLREVSETLNLSITIIQAIEADDYERLPGPVFARGYVRAYARLLGLDPDPLLALSPKRDDPATATRRSTGQSFGNRLARRPGLILGAVGLLLLVAVLFGLQWWPAGDEAGTGGATVAQREQAERVLEDPPWNFPELGDPPVVVPFEEAPVEDRMAPGGNPMTGGAVAGPGPDQPQQTPSTPLRLTALGEDRLSLRFTADSWVQVRDASGADLYSELGRAGDHVELVGQGPLRILLGNAPGAQLAFNGEPVPLGPHTRNNVATLVLGH
jgi:cytoskeleton protein RodZ